MIKYIFIMLIMMIGCVKGSSPFHYTQMNGQNMPLKVVSIYVDKDFGEGDLLAIDDAARQWNYALNGYVKLEIVTTKFDMEPEVINKAMSEGGWLLLRIPTSSKLYHDVGDQYTLAFVDKVGGNVMHVVRDRVDNDWMRGLMLHEMGHLLGVKSDMIYLKKTNGRLSDYQCLDKSVVMEVGAYQKLPLGNLNFCVFGPQP